MDLLFRLEKPIDSKNRALRKLNKSFKSVLNYFNVDPRPQSQGYIHSQLFSLKY